MVSVVAVAHRLFTEQGFDKTTVDQIAAQAGLSGASLFRHFGTKEDIVLGRLEESGRRIAEALIARPEHERHGRRCAGRSTFSSE